MSGDGDIDKRRSVRDFFDALMAGSQPNTKSSSMSANLGISTTPRPDSGPIYMPYAVPVPAGPQASQPHVHFANPPSFSFPPYRPSSSPSPASSSRHPLSYGQAYGGNGPSYGSNGPSYGSNGPSYGSNGPSYGGHGHSHSHSHNHGPPSFGPFSPLSMPPLPPQSHHFPIHNHYDPYGQHSRPVAIAIPLPLHAIPVHIIPHNEDAIHKDNQYGDYGDGMAAAAAASTKFTLFADPFEGLSDDDLFDGQQNARPLPLPLKYIPIQKNTDN
ncbi:uncharacterized protein LOC128951290 [Oppia nitens]|uniref:uncharacterized protein LOC128951290 n=1 Tax=Oppia nitens TaxID=1686743 RepID=UPI0023DA6A77|nr:uncharacterized protein LOC128951290 [Oppia nitens]